MSLILCSSDCSVWISMCPLCICPVFSWYRVNLLSNNFYYTVLCIQDENNVDKTPVLRLLLSSSCIKTFQLFTLPCQGGKVWRDRKKTADQTGQRHISYHINQVKQWNGRAGLGRTAVQKLSGRQWLMRNYTVQHLFCMFFYLYYYYYYFPLFSY